MDAIQGAKTSAFPVAHKIPSKNLQMGGKVGGQKLRETALAKDQSVRLRVAKSRRSALQWTKRSLALGMINERLQKEAVEGKEWATQVTICWELQVCSTIAYTIKHFERGWFV